MSKFHGFSFNAAALNHFCCVLVHVGIIRNLFLRPGAAFLLFRFLCDGFRPLMFPSVWTTLSVTVISVIKLFNYFHLYVLFFFPFSSFSDEKHKRMWNETVPTAYILGGPEYFISKVISLINSRASLSFALRPVTNLWFSCFYLRHRITQGSTINLTCIIKFSPDAPSHTFWHFKDKVIN